MFLHFSFHGTYRIPDKVSIVVKFFKGQQNSITELPKILQWCQVNLALYVTS